LGRSVSRRGSRSPLNREREPLSTFPTIANSVVALVVILLEATFFTNAVEILGGRLGMHQEAMGSLLTILDTALPESVIAAVAILGLDITDGELTRGTDIGVGAILGTPLVLATLVLILQSTIHVTFGLLSILWKFAALGLFAAILALTSGGLTYLVLGDPGSFGPYTW
jgi:Ca2+/Na+ antiporter